MVITVLWSWVFNSAGRSILIAVLLHASGNATGALMGRWFGQLPESMGGTMFRLYLGLAVLAIVLTRGRLGYRSDPSPATAPV